MLEKKRISELFEITAGGDIEKERYCRCKKGRFIYPVYSNQLTDKGLFGFYNKYAVKFDSITVTARGTVGHAEARINEKYMPVGRLLVLKPKENISLEYIKNLINYKIKFANESTGVPQLTAPQIGKYSIEISKDIREQNAIADILSRIDNLIVFLQKTIDKKEKIKLGVEEELFNNKNYKLMKLSEVTTMSAGGTPQTTNNKYYEGGKINWLSISDITNSNKKIKSTMVKITEEGLLNSSAKMFKRGTLFFAMYASIGKVIISEADMCCSQAILGMKCENINRDFLYYYLSFKKNELAKMGQTGTQSNLSKKIMQDYIISIPNSIEVQKRIASILNNFDDEIESLTEKLIKYKKIKQGMMEDLLTGKVRLKYE